MKKLACHRSARTDLRVYLGLLVGGMFLLAGFTVDPSSNCDPSGRECAPWLVPVAFCLGWLTTGICVALLIINRRWGSRVDIAQRRIEWWDSGVSRQTHVVSIDAVARIKVQRPDESSDRVFLYDKHGERLRFPTEHATPYHADRWARDLAVHFPHIQVEIEEL